MSRVSFLHLNSWDRQYCSDESCLKSKDKRRVDSKKEIVDAFFLHKLSISYVQVLLVYKIITEIGSLFSLGGVEFCFFSLSRTPEVYSLFIGL